MKMPRAECRDNRTRELSRSRRPCPVVQRSACVARAVGRRDSYGTRDALAGSTIESVERGSWPGIVRTRDATTSRLRRLGTCARSHCSAQTFRPTSGGRGPRVGEASGPARIQPFDERYAM